MHLIVIDKNNQAELKRFALTFSVAFPVVFMLLLPWLFGLGIPVWPLVISATLMLLYLVYPRGIYYPQLVWAYIAFVLGWINTRIILGLVFYLMIFPVGWLVRGLGKLNYNQNNNTNSDSFWVQREAKAEKENLENPF